MRPAAATPQLLLLLLLLLLRGLCGPARKPAPEADAEVDKPLPVTRAEGVLGRKAALPCDISTRRPDDEVVMVLWFKQDEGEPLYSFDLRGRKPGPAKLWPSSGSAERRAHLRANTDPAQLVVGELVQADEGVYRCRVDYRDSPTRNSRIALTVIVPPERPVIYDSKRRDRSKVHEPLSEGSDVGFICEVAGGRPRPRVTWLLNGRLLDASYEHRRGVAVNHVTLRAVGREKQGARLVCQASNTDLAPPLSTATQLDLNLRPLTVQILGKDRRLSAGRRYDVECRTSGSRPPARLSWWKGGRQVKRGIKKVADEGGFEAGVLTFTPGVDDDGKYLTCRSENPAIPESALEDKWRLAVHYKPMVRVRLGAAPSPRGVAEGDDVLLQCLVRANPAVLKLSWFREGQELRQNVTAGAILSDQSLVLQGVSRASAGSYSCSADNAEGRGVSDDYALRVMYAPACRHQLPQTLRAARGAEAVELRCEVDAFPPPQRYRWTLPGGGAEEGPALRFRPAGEGQQTLQCAASNQAGDQQRPCEFLVQAAESLPAPANCSVWNHSADALLVGCLDAPGPRYLLELLELPGLAPLDSVSAAAGGAPVFQLRGLRPGVSYSARVFALDARGRSPPAVLQRLGLRAVAELVDPAPPAPIHPSLTLVLALTGLGAVLAAAVLTACRLHCRRPRRLDKDKPPPDQAVAITLMEPDVVPGKNRKDPLKSLARMCRTPARRRTKRRQTQQHAARSQEEQQNHVNSARRVLGGAGVCGSGPVRPGSPATATATAVGVQESCI